jgi:hypothetical protein
MKGTLGPFVKEVAVLKKLDNVRKEFEQFVEAPGAEPSLSCFVANLLPNSTLGLGLGRILMMLRVRQKLPTAAEQPKRVWERPSNGLLVVPLRRHHPALEVPLELFEILLFLCKKMFMLESSGIESNIFEIEFPLRVKNAEKAACARTLCAIRLARLFEPLMSLVALRLPEAERFLLPNLAHEFVQYWKT